jgi:hypothetical protein
MTAAQCRLPVRGASWRGWKTARARLKRIRPGPDPARQALSILEDAGGAVSDLRAAAAAAAAAADAPSASSANPGGGDGPVRGGRVGVPRLALGGPPQPVAPFSPPGTPPPPLCIPLPPPPSAVTPHGVPV